MSTDNTTNGTAPAPRLQSSKAKSRLGVPMDHVITWVPFALPAEDNAILKAVAKTRDIEVHNVVVPALAKWWEDNKAAMTAEADEFLKTTEKSKEELEKEIARAQAQLAKFQAMLDNKK